jgi:TetR/AcrR family transcriptional regulator, regulator of biofilm formation and stress response
MYVVSRTSVLTMERTEESILQATLGVIVKGGVAAVTYREVAAAAGVALGTISYKFTTREALLRAAFEYFLTQSAAALRAFSASARVKTVEELAALITAIIRAEVQDPSRARIAEYELLLAATRDEQLAHALAEWDRTLVAELGALVEQVGGTAPFATALTILELTRGFQLTALSEREPNFDELERRVARLLLAFQTNSSDVKQAATPARAARKRSR